MKRPEEMLLLLASELTRGATAVELPAHACSAAVETLGCDAGAITLGGSGTGRVIVCSTDETVRVVEEAQEIAGQGPTIDAYDSGRPVTLRVGEEGAIPAEHWPLLSIDPLRELAPLVVHSVPLRGPEGVLGVLTLIHRGRKDLAEDFENSAADVAEFVAAAVLASVPADVDELAGAPWSQRAGIYQATGMVMAQMQLDAGDALALLRAHAFASGIALPAMAQEVLARRLRFGEPTGEETQ